MPTNLALPVGHDASQLSTIDLCIGKLFRQPVNVSTNSNDPNFNGNFSQGLELWLNDTASDRKLFSMFDGILSYVPSTSASQPNMLILQLDENAQNEINSIPHLFEPNPTKIIYENVDESEVGVAISNLILNAYNNADPTDTLGISWHPIMRMMAFNAPFKNLRIQLEEASNINDVIQDLMYSFIDGTQKFIVKSGDPIGAADNPLTTDNAPQGCNNIYRRVTIITEEYVNNRLNPNYYLWLFLKNNYATGNNKKINVITELSISGDTFDHPLLNASSIGIDISYSLDNLPDDFKPRIPVQLPNEQTPVILFPVGPLQNDLGFRSGQQQSSILWRINNSGNLNFETLIRPNSPNTMENRPIGICGVQAANKIDVCATTSGIYNTKVQTIWDNYEADINDICYQLQFPAEYIIASIGQESVPDANPRSLALETFFNYHITACQQAGVSQNIINAYVSLRRQDRYELLVPAEDPNNPNHFSASDAATLIAPNAPAPANTLTWGHLLELINVWEYVQVGNTRRFVSPTERMSPGVVQTLVSTARTRLNGLTNIFEDAEALFNVDPIPNTAAGLFFWLCTGRHSILASAAYHKYNYVSKRSAMDLPKVGATYNAGVLASRLNLDDTNPNPPPSAIATPNPWLLRFNRLDYPRNLSRYYNSVRNNQNILPHSRYFLSL